MDKETLFKPRLPEDVVPIPNVGEVRVRALSRYEVADIKNDEDVVSYGMVDPEMSKEDVVEWFKAAPLGEARPVIHKVMELSGLRDGADKEAYKSVRDES